MIIRFTNNDYCLEYPIPKNAIRTWYKNSKLYADHIKLSNGSKMFVEYIIARGPGKSQFREGESCTYFAYIKNDEERVFVWYNDELTVELVNTDGTIYYTFPITSNRLKINTEEQMSDCEEKRGIE